MSSKTNNNKIDLEHGNYFIEYFFSIGLHHDLIFEELLYHSTINGLNEIANIKPSVISKFPPVEKANCFIDESLLMRQCFPNGFKIVDSQHTLPNEIFSFSLNNPISKSNQDIYFTCLLFYENFENFFRLKEKYASFDNEKDYDRMSMNTTKDQMKRIFKLSTKSIPYLDIRLSKEEGDVGSKNKLSANTIRLDEEPLTTGKVSIRNSKPNYKTFYAPKVICFASFYPFRYEHSKVLKTIYNYSVNNGGRIRKPIEKILENLILETPAPPKGLYNVEFHLLNEKYNLSQPANNSLPLVSLEMEKIFSYFKVEQVLDIYKYILLEAKVLFFSKDKHGLTNVVEAFLSLLYPFKYVYPAISILPVDNFSIIDNYNSFVFGINMSYVETFFSEYNIENNKNIFVVDMDKKNCFFIPMPLTDLDVISIEELTHTNVIEDTINNIEIPKKSKLKISEKIKTYIREIKENTNIKEGKDNFIRVICDIFCYFIVSILKDYAKYIISSDEDFENINTIIYSQSLDGSYPKLNIHDLWKTEDFLNNAIQHFDKPFFKKLTETKMFFNFVFKKIFPKDNNEKMEIIFFDECIIEKKNKRIFSKNIYTPFIHSKAYEIKSTYSVPKSRGFNKGEADFLKIPENMKKSLFYGQEVVCEDSPFNNVDFSLIYHIFPKLVYDDCFFPDKLENKYLINHIQLKSTLKEEVDAITTEILANPTIYYIYSNTNYQFSKLIANIYLLTHTYSDFANRLNIMENYIYLSWVHLFSISFYSFEDLEKPYRFQQLLEVLKKLNWIDEETKNLLFVSILKYGDDPMSIKIFELFYKIGKMTNYTSYAFLMRKLSHPDSKNINVTQKKYSISSRRSNISMISVNSMTYYQPIPVQYYKRRSLLPSNNRFDDEEENEEIAFETEETCMECKGIINLVTLSFDFEKIRKELFWAQCPHCSNYIIPKLGVKIGKEETINDKNHFRVVLYSPHYLKQNFHLALFKEFSIYLDLEVFKKKYNSFFWNAIWYFQIMQLPFDFIIPYKKTPTGSVNYFKTTTSYDVLISPSYDTNIEEHFNFNPNVISNFDVNPLKNSFPSKDLQICSQAADHQFHHGNEVIFSIPSNYTSTGQENVVEIDHNVQASFINDDFLESNDPLNDHRYSVKTTKVKRVNRELRKKFGFNSMDLNSEANKLTVNFHLEKEDKIQLSDDERKASKNIPLNEEDLI